MNNILMTAAKILIVEHDSMDIEMVRNELRKGGIVFVSEAVQEEADYRAAVDRFLPDIILSDYSFPSFDGLAAFEIRQEIAPEIPFVFVSGALGEETSVDLIKRGVTDFVSKDKMYTLCLKVNRALAEARAAVLLENRLAEARLNHQREITEAVMAAQEKERASIGWELQENIGEVLASARIYIKLASTNVSNRKLFLSKSCMLLQEAIDAGRKISKTLAIPDALVVGLYGRIRNLLHDMKEINSISIDFRTNDVREDSLDEKLQLNLFRIVQEQVTNILKHANVPTATISLTREDDRLILMISDNGIGCDMSKKTNGVGIINIRSRTEASRGSLNILTHPGEGYALKVALPFANDRGIQNRRA